MDNRNADYSVFKRTLENYSVDPEVRKVIDRAPESELRSAIYYILYGEMDPFTSNNPYVLEFSDGIRIVANRIIKVFLRESIPSEQLFYYLDTQRNRCRMENRAIRNHPIIYYYPCAFELSAGCSVQCSFCGLQAGKYRGYFPHTAENAALFRSAVCTVQEYAGALTGFCPCYFATEPLDNPDYEAFLTDLRELTGEVPQTTTAVPERHPEKIRKLMDFCGEKVLRENAALRFSVRSLEQFRCLTECFTPEELRYVELIANNPESVNRISASGRATNNRKIPAQKKLAYSICCIAGVKINFCEKTIQFIEPEIPSPYSPLGYRVLACHNFTNEESLTAAIRELYDRYAVGLVPAEGQLCFNTRTEHCRKDNTVVFQGDGISYSIPDDCLSNWILKGVEHGLEIKHLVEGRPNPESPSDELNNRLNALFQRGYLRPAPEHVERLK